MGRQVFFTGDEAGVSTAAKIQKTRAVRAAAKAIHPAALGDFALGFALTEGLIERPREQVLVEQQVLNREIGPAHAAPRVWLAGQVIAVREDSGRDNALDQLGGARIKREFPPGFALATCRASYAIVMKAVAADIGVVAAGSAPTARAVRLAETCNVALLTFVRGADGVIYSHAERIADGGP